MAAPYEVAIHLTATNGVSSVLAGISKEVLGLRGSVGELQKGFSALRLGFIGAAGVAAGLGAFAVLKDMAGYAKDLSHELTQIQKLGINPSQFDQVKRAAQGLTTAVPGVTENQALGVYGSAYSIFGHEEALSLMGPMGKFLEVLGNQNHDYEGAEKSLFSMVRAADLMGQITDSITKKADPAKLQHFLDLGVKTMTASEGKITPETWLSIAQQGGAALAGMSDQGLMDMAIIAQGMGGPRAGTALTSAFQQIIGGKMTQYSAQELHRLGLVGDFDVGRGGHILWHKDALNGPFGKDMQVSPLMAAADLVAAMNKAGITDPNAQRNELFTIFGRQTTQRMFSDMLRNLPQMLSERERIGGAMGVNDALGAQQAHDITQGAQNMSAAWTNLMNSISGPGSDTMVTGLNSIAGGIQSLATSMNGTDPTKIKNVMEAGALVAGGLFAAGTLAVVTAIGAALGAGGVVIVGLTALGAGVAYLAAQFSGRDLFETMKGWWGGFGQVIDSAQAKLLSYQEAFNKAVAGVFSGLSTAFSNFTASLPTTADITHALKGVSDRLSAAIAAIPGAVAAAIAAVGHALSSALSSAITGAASALGRGAASMPDPGLPGRQGLVHRLNPPAPPAPPLPKHSQNEGRPIILTMNGREVGRAVFREANVAMEHPQGAAAFDFYRSYIGPDANFDV